MELFTLLFELLVELVLLHYRSISEALIALNPIRLYNENMFYLKA